MRLISLGIYGARKGQVRVQVRRFRSKMVSEKRMEVDIDSEALILIYIQRTYV